MSSDDRLRPGELDELQRRQPDRPGADDQARLVGLGAAAVDRVAADRQGLDQGELVERQLRRGVELPRRQEELRPHPAVAVDAQDFELLAAVRDARGGWRSCSGR